MKKYNQEEINTKFRQRKCLECSTGILNNTGSSPNGGWVAYSICNCCGIKYEFQESDMGQTLPYLRSNADIKEVTLDELLKVLDTSMDAEEAIFRIFEEYNIARK